MRKVIHSHKPVWIDVKKGSVELKPSRITHCIFDVLSDAERQKPNPKNITKDLEIKAVKRHGVQMGKVSWGQLQGMRLPGRIFRRASWIQLPVGQTRLDAWLTTSQSFLCC